MQDHYQGITPYLFFDDAEAAINWYRDNFGFEEIDRWTDDNGKVANAEMRVGQTEIWLDGSGKQKRHDTRPVWIGIWVDDVDAVFEKITANGVECDPPVTREFGVRMLNVDDGLGHLWGFVKRV